VSLIVCVIVIINGIIIIIIIIIIQRYNALAVLGSFTHPTPEDEM